MGLPAAKFSLDGYLAWENEQADRHEFFRGETFAMVGARRVHGRVVANLSRRERPAEFFENAAMLALMGAFSSYAQGR